MKTKGWMGTKSSISSKGLLIDFSLSLSVRVNDGVSVCRRSFKCDKIQEFVTKYNQSLVYSFHFKLQEIHFTKYFLIFTFLDILEPTFTYKNKCLIQFLHLQQNFQQSTQPLKMPQNDFMDLHRKRHGQRLDAQQRRRKKDARKSKIIAKKAQTLKGLKAKLFNKQRFKQKIQMKKTIKQHQEKNAKSKSDKLEQGAMPTYLMDREQQRNSKVLTNMIKQKRKEKAGKWSVPVQKVKPMTQAEMFEVIRSGKRKRKCWKRRINKICFVGENYTRKPPKHQRFIRPMGLRFKDANVTHPQLKTTFKLPILSIKKNPQSNMYTSLGVVTKGTVMEINVSQLGLVTQTGKVVWSKYAQVTNNPELDGCINAVLLV